MSSGQQDFDFGRECEDSDTDNFLISALEDDHEDFKHCFSNGTLMEPFLQNLEAEYHLKKYKTILCMDAYICKNENCFDAHPEEQMRQISDEMDEETLMNAKKAYEGIEKIQPKVDSTFSGGGSTPPGNSD